MADFLHRGAAGMAILRSWLWSTRPRLFARCITGPRR